MPMISPVLPLYYRTKQAILRYIEDHELLPGDVLPAERDLEREFAVSRVTVRRALSELEREGKIRRKHGRGAFVAPAKIGRGLGAVTSFTQEMRARGLQPSSRVLQFGTQAPPRHIAHQLGVGEGKPVLYVERVRLADDEPIALSQSYLNLPSWVVLRPQDLAGEASLWDLLDRQGVRIAAVDKTVEASLADDYEANALEIPAGSLFLVVETVAFAADGTAIEANRVSYRGDRHKLFFHQAR
jgi:GntR family transcriptional regulator